MLNLKWAIAGAYKADEEFTAAVAAAGFKSRWDVPRATMLELEPLRLAYYTKVAADEIMHAAFVEARGR
jgi:hypothetical protein